MPAATSLEEAIRDAGESWLLDTFAPPDQAIPHLHKTLRLVHDLGQQRLGENAPNLTEAAMVQEYNRHPLQVRGFFQSLGGTRTPEMLLMVWRIIQGMEVKEVDRSYRRQQCVSARVIVESAKGEQDPP